MLALQVVQGGSALVVRHRNPAVLLFSAVECGHNEGVLAKTAKLQNAALNMNGSANAGVGAAAHAPSSSSCTAWHLRIRIIVDLCSLCHPSQGGVLQLALDCLGLLSVLAGTPGAILPLHMQMHLQGRRLDVLGDVDDLRQARHTECDVLG